MTQRFVNSLTGADSNGGTSWADARATSGSTSGISAIDTVGDEIYYGSGHAESFSGSLAIALAGTAANPTKVFSVAAGATPSAVEPGATISQTNAGTNLTITGYAWIEGMTFESSGAIAISTQRYKNCKFRINNGGSAGAVSLPQANTQTKCVITNCTFKWQASSNKFVVGHHTEVRGGSFESGSAQPANFLSYGADGRGGYTLVEGFDMSAGAASMNLVAGGSSFSSGVVIFRNCRLPDSWSGSLLAPTIAAPGLRVEMYNCDSGDTNYRMMVEDYAGTSRTETSTVKTGGSTDGVVPFSIKMATSASANRWVGQLISPELPAVWNDTVGSALTVSVDVLADSTTDLTNAEVWLEVQYLGTSGYPLSSIVRGSVTDSLATPAAQGASTATWSNLPANPKKHKLSVSITPQKAGFIQGRVFLTKPSFTLFVDAKMQVS